MEDAYGFISSIENIMVRHCFIVDKEGRAIDLTLFAIKSFDENSHSNHVSFAVTKGVITAVMKISQ
ncbi:hypothetical protein BTA30_18740 [Bacillus swezeyi]|uniref:Uncharacterized protein n=1 Tax=Bacillus swezeyi TaxID=1925020 RepID=A0A1R1RLR8_9BACI|nr:hypothetical protein BW143_20230 [Bacillus swezeyi]OMI26927.1 hypothetical protein BTA30_18740 [Bacillus swezeyi]